MKETTDLIKKIACMLEALSMGHHGRDQQAACNSRFVMLTAKLLSNRPGSNEHTEAMCSARSWCVALRAEVTRKVGI